MKMTRDEILKKINELQEMLNKLTRIEIEENQKALLVAGYTKYQPEPQKTNAKENRND